MNNIIGLGQHKNPFIYLDEYITSPNWESLHTEISFGIAKSKWVKRYVSSGVHDNWSHLEITPRIRDYQTILSPDQQKLFEQLTDTEEKIKFMNCITQVSHPFWIIFIRNNKRIERTGIENKAISEDCHWTENAKHFPTLINLVESMPFESVGRVIIFMTESNNQTVPHFDAGNAKQRNEKPNDDFVWFTTSNNTKKIFVMDGITEEKIYPENKKFIWWNEMDFHGTDAVPGFSFSVRIDGKFKKDIKDLMLGSTEY
jgi:hypothetical protein